MAKKHRDVCYRVGGGRKVHRRNVWTKSEGTLEECQQEIRQVLAATHDVLPSQIELLDGPPPPEPRKPRAGEIRRLRKAELLSLIENTEALRNASPPIDRDGTNAELEDAIIRVLGLEE